MKFIKKIWGRILISLILGGFATEIISIKTGTTYTSLMPAFICFLVLTAWVWFEDYKYYYFPNWGSNNKDAKNNNDILDDEIS